MKFIKAKKSRKLLILTLISVVGLGSSVLLNNYTPNKSSTEVESMPLPLTEKTEDVSLNTPPPPVTKEPETKEVLPSAPKPSAKTTQEPTTKSGDYTNVYITYYGWYDNSPSGKNIAYPHKKYSASIHDKAGGTGSYKDPITFATDRDLYKPGTIIYVPYIKKYIIMEDMCEGCIENWQDEKRKHIDIWIESKDSFEDELYQCQRKYTRSSIEVELNPPSDREVNKTPLFNTSTGKCL